MFWARTAIYSRPFVLSLLIIFLLNFIPSQLMLFIQVSQFSSLYLDRVIFAVPELINCLFYVL